jgi:hypothetical protein
MDAIVLEVVIWLCDVIQALSPIDFEMGIPPRIPE